MFDLKSDRKIIAILSLALISQVLLLMWHLGWLGDLNRLSENKSRGVYAGQVEKKENQIKKRTSDGLVWEDTEVQEPLYFYDSILTLSQSSAILKLENGTQIHLSENTLVTLEPPSTQNSNEIRIRFDKGLIRARNPFDSTQIANKTVTLTVTPDSEVQIGSRNSEHMSVEVLRGEAQIQQTNETLVLGENQGMNIEQNKKTLWKISTELQWKHESEIRRYTHQKNENININWTGSAEKIWLEAMSTDQQKQEILIENNVQSHVLSLNPGEYRIYLESKEQRSPSLSIQIWPAPILHLIKPLPRNREHPGKLHFIWTALPEANSYELIAQGKNKSLRIPSKQNEIHLEVDTEDDIQWSVEAIDGKGVIIPAPYSYPLYIRKDPFAAPRLKAPQAPSTKTQKSPNAWWFPFLITPARAENLDSAILQWEHIEGADFYNLEISESADFRNLVIQQKVTTPEFLWNAMKKNKTYYWRVAAGDLNGRLGLFSEPMILTAASLQEITQWNKRHQIVLPVQTPPPIIIDKNPSPNPESPNKNIVIEKQEFQQEEPSSPWSLKWESFGLNLHPYIFQHSSKIPNSGQAKFSGTVISSMNFHIKTRLNNNSKLSLIGQYSQTGLQAQPIEDYPFQSDLTYHESSLHLNRQYDQSLWFFGVQILNSPIIQRLQPENLGLRTGTGFGINIGLQKETSHWNGQITLSPLVWENSLAFRVSGQYLWKPWPWLSTGPSIDFLYQTNLNIQSYRTGLQFGFEY